jgi:hypothetical protein
MLTIKQMIVGGFYLQIEEGNGSESQKHKRNRKRTRTVSVLVGLILTVSILMFKLTAPAFGSLYGNVESKPAIDEVPIEFDTHGPHLNTDFDPATNIITVQNSGVYEVTATLSVLFPASPSAQQAFFYIKVNDDFFTPDVAFDAAVNENAGLVLNTGKTIQIGLNAGDELSVVPTGIAGEVNYRLASLTVNRIGPLVADHHMDN